MNRNGSITSGLRQSKTVGKRNGRKRARDESSKKRFSCTNTVLLPLTIAGIAVVCSLNVANDPASFAFAFYHAATLPTIKRRANYFFSNKIDDRLRKHKSQRHDRKSITCWTLNDSNYDDNNDILDDVEELPRDIDGRKSRNQNSRSSSSLDSSLIVAASSSLYSTSPVSSSSHLPPWLALAEEEFAGLSSLAEASKRIRREIELLEGLLLSFRGGNFFSKADVRDVIRAIYWSASLNIEDRNTIQKVSKIVGSVSFCRLLLKLEDETFDINKNNGKRKGKGKNNKTVKDNKSYLITKDVLLASILHYSECVDIRYDGVNNEVRKSLLANFVHENDVDSAVVHLPTSNNLRMLTTIADDKNNENTSEETTLVLSRDANKDQTLQDDASIVMRSSRETTNNSNNDTFENIFSHESLEIANAATRLKRTEILTSVTLTSCGDQHKRRRPLKKEEYAAVRDLLVSLTDDWRALAIRCVASLFRLEGILKHSKINSATGQFSSHHSRRGAETTLAAKDSLQMYANLSQQMGLHRLQTQLEAKAFRILYPRQYSASSILFQEHGAAMNAISGFLSNQLEQMLCEDLSLMHELENLEVASRVKEPYSFWKKLLKKRIHSVAMPTEEDNHQCIDSIDIKSCLVKSSEPYGPQREMIRSATDLSILEVNDGVALRVILKARKIHVDEPAETTRARERILCYYIHHMVRSKWPETDLERVKDYIRHPKANGYQSLHHTSKITRNRQDFFFEVQIRSEEMHHFAEFGVAAHSTYKLDVSSIPKVYPSLKPSPSSSSPSPPSSAVVSSTVLKKLDSFNQSSTSTTLSNREISRSDSCELPVIGVSNSRNSGPYIHALEKTRQNLMQSRVYVFLAGGSSSTLETGQLLTLSAGSLITDVLDTLRKVNEEFAFKDHEVRVWCNGKFSLLDKNIKNGDTILIQPMLQSSLPSVTEILVNKTSSANTILVQKF